MVFGSAWVTTASTTTASSFWTSPSGLPPRCRGARLGLRLGVEDLAKCLSLRTSARSCPRIACHSRPSPADTVAGMDPDGERTARRRPSLADELLLLAVESSPQARPGRVMDIG